MSSSAPDAAMVPALTAQEWRDLLWLADCPDLMELTPPSPLAPLTPVLIPPQDDGIPPVLVPRPFHRVGDYVERLVRHWLGITPGVSAIEQGILLRDGSRTVGELDFLFRHGGRLHHLEVALKFYLHYSLPGHQSSASFSHFPGPNATDNFEKKRDRLLSHQLPLGRVTFPEIHASHALVKGIVFYRPGEGPPAVLPATMNPAHRRGTWIRSKEIDRLLGEPWAQDYLGIVLEKPHWLSGWTGFPEDGLHPMEELHHSLRSHFNDQRTMGRPVLLNLEHEGEAQESTRVFVVPAHWPDRSIRPPEAGSAASG